MQGCIAESPTRRLSLRSEATTFQKKEAYDGGGNACSLRFKHTEYRSQRRGQPKAQDLNHNRFGGKPKTLPADRQADRCIDRKRVQETRVGEADTMRRTSTSTINQLVSVLFDIQVVSLCQRAGLVHMTAEPTHRTTKEPTDLRSLTTYL